MLKDSGVNDLLVSVDAFHQETIPLDAVRVFLSEAKAAGIPTRLQPAWLVSRDDTNPYNIKTESLLRSLSDLSIPIGEGNVIFPEGNAKIYLGEYFANSSPENPYEENPFDVRCLSFLSNGNVLQGNVYKNGILDIICGYQP